MNDYYESFPRMWDQQDRPVPAAGRFRIIPTYVGSTLMRANHHAFRTNHSHVCGINSDNRTITHPPFESFPRMWDQRLQQIGPASRNRIIPTYVGSTRTRSSYRLESSNHSHVCGINGLMAIHAQKRYESFPRMWDQPSYKRRKKAPARIIPTYVGSTGSPFSMFAKNANHSHVCGINPGWRRCHAAENESFPRMWDQLNIVPIWECGTRIIPTYVGSTIPPACGCAGKPNHSHVCGINAT